MNRQLRLARVVTTPITFTTLLKEQISQIRVTGIDVTLVAGEESGLAEVAQQLGVKHRFIPMVRQPSLSHDLVSLLFLYRLFRRERYDVVHSSTPKAGLLTAVAASATAIPIRLHTYTGQRWVTLSGVSKVAIKTFDRLIGMLSTQTYADSKSQRQFLVDEGVVRSQKVRVLGSGSISGVNMQRFSADRWGESERLRTRSELGIPGESTVIVFVGRVTKDKGIVELVEAFIQLSEVYSGIFLVIVGPSERDLDPIPSRTSRAIETNRRILVTGFSSNPERYLGAADIFCLPSYREGFGTVVVEAGAMALPTVATAVTGLVDAVIDGETGYLVPPKNVELLTEALKNLIEKPELRKELGLAARDRTRKEFDSYYVNSLVIEEYFRLARLFERGVVGRCRADL